MEAARLIPPSMAVPQTEEPGAIPAGASDGLGDL